MTHTPQDGGPAFPSERMEKLYNALTGEIDFQCAKYAGMSQRAFAAIKLRVPDSGIDWLDAMILQAKRDEFAGQAVSAMIGACFSESMRDDGMQDESGRAPFFEAIAKMAKEAADAMIAERNKP